MNRIVWNIFHFLGFLFCFSACASRPVSATKSTGVDDMIPVVQVTRDSRMIKLIDVVTIYANGTVVDQKFERVTTNQIKQAELKLLLREIERNGFFEISELGIEQRIKDEERKARISPLVIIDGDAVRISAVSGSKSNSIHWPNLEESATHYSSISQLKKLNDSVGAIYRSSGRKH